MFFGYNIILIFLYICILDFVLKTYNTAMLLLKSNFNSAQYIAGIIMKFHNIWLVY